MKSVRIVDEGRGRCGVLGLVDQEFGRLSIPRGQASSKLPSGLNFFRLFGPDQWFDSAGYLGNKLGGSDDLRFDSEGEQSFVRWKDFRAEGRLHEDGLPDYFDIGWQSFICLDHRNKVFCFSCRHPGHSPLSAGS